MKTLIKSTIKSNKEDVMKTFTLDEVLSKNFDESFITHMRNAMMMSFYKHQDKRGDGNINNYVGKISMDLLLNELKAFNDDHNTEHMVNIANYAMVRYMFPQGDETYTPTDSNKSIFNNGKTQSVFEHLRDYILEND